MVFQSKGSNTGDMRELARYFPRNFVPSSAIQSNERYIESVSLVSNITRCLMNAITNCALV